MPEVVVSSRVPASPAEVWKRVASITGVNHELGPFFAMTAPRGTASLEDVPIGRRWFRSWVLLFGVIPIDYDDLTILRIEPGRGFLERSEMLSQRVWEHERTLEAETGGTRVTDRVRFEPRVPFALGAQRALFAAVFRHRHRRLASSFAG